MHYFSQFYPPFAPGFMPGFMLALIPLFIALMIAVVVLKGYALWYAARASQKGWFIALLVINTLGILEIVYLVWFRPKSPTASASSPANESAPTVPSSSAQ